MDRVNIVEPPKISIEEITSWRELRAAISSFHRQFPNAPLSNNIGLAQICREWFKNIGASDEFDASDPKAIEELITIIDGEIEIEKEAIQLHQEENIREFDSKALDSQRLEILLEEFDKHRAIKNAEELQRELSKNPALHEVDRKAIRKIIDQKILLQTEAINRGEPLKVADTESDLQIIVQEQLEEAGVDSDKAEKVAISAATIAVKSETLTETKREIGKVLSAENIDSDLRVFVEETTTNKTAEVIIEIKKEEIVDKFIEELDSKDRPLSKEQITKIRDLVEIKIEEKVLESIPTNVEQVNVKGEIGLIKVEKDNLVADILKAANGSLSDLDLNRLIKEKIELRVEKGIIEAQPEVVGSYRKETLRKELITEVLTRNPTTSAQETAETAKFFTEFYYPKDSVAETVIREEKMYEAGIKAGYQGPELEMAVEKAEALTQLVNSKDEVRSNIEKILARGRGLENNNKANAAVDMARELQGNESAIRSIEAVRKIVNFQNRFNDITGNGVIKLGNLINSDKLRNWGQRILINNKSKVLSDFGQAAASWFGQLKTTGFTPARMAMDICNKWLAGGLNSFRILGGVANETFKGLGKGVFGGLNVALKKGGINALSTLKGMASKLAPKLAGAAGKLALKLAGLPGIILSLFDLKDILKLVTYVVGGVFVALILVLPMIFFGPQVASLVPTTGAGLGQDVNVGFVDEVGNPIVATGNGFGGGLIEGADCSVADAVVGQDVKQCWMSWAKAPLNKSGTSVCYAGCGPTSSAMVIMRLHGDATPDVIAMDSAFTRATTNGTSIGENINVINSYYGSGTAQPTTCHSKQEIANMICQGHKIVMIAANVVTDGGGVGGHFLLAIGVKNGVIMTKDPYYNDNTQTPMDPIGGLGSQNEFGGGLHPGQILGLQGCIAIDADKVRSLVH